MAALKNPKIELPATVVDRFLNALALLLLLTLWAVVVYYYPTLPNEVPTHFDFLGKPDDYSGKSTLYLLPIIATIISFLFWLLQNKPHIYNYPVAITDDNASVQYRLAKRMMMVLLSSILVLFLYIVMATIRTAQGSANGLGNLFIFFVLGILFLPLGFYFYLAVKNK